MSTGRPYSDEPTGDDRLGKVERILVPLDGSPSAESVLPVVVPLATRLQAQLVLLAVHEPGVPARGALGVPAVDRRIDDEARAAMGAYLRTVADRLPHRDLPIDTVVLQGQPADRIAAHAEESGVDMIAIASHGRGGFSRLWLGSVTDRLLRHVTLPMLVVHAREVGDAAPAARPPQRILVALDGTYEAEGILEPTFAVFGREGIEYTVLRVAVQPNPFQRATETDIEFERDTQVILQEVENYLAAIVERYRGAGYTMRSAMRIGSDPARGILAAVDDEKADVVALTTHGAGVVQRAIIGSVADKVARGSPVPVFVKRLTPRGAGREGAHEGAGARARAAAP